MGSLIPGGRIIIHTNANTGFEEWKQLMLEECARRGFDPSKLRPLTIKHAWEGGDSPASFVIIEMRKMEWAANKAQINRKDR